MNRKLTSNNEELKKYTSQVKDIYGDIYSTTLNIYSQTDEEFAKREEIIDKIKQLSELERELLFLYSNLGATKSARLLQISREYMHFLIRKIKQKINTNEDGKQ